MEKFNAANFIFYVVRNGEGELSCDVSTWRWLKVMQGHLTVSRAFYTLRNQLVLWGGSGRGVGAGSRQIPSHMSRWLSWFDFERNRKWILKPCWMKDVTAKLVVEALWCSSCCFYCYFYFLTSCISFFPFFLRKRFFSLFPVSLWLSI